MYKENLDADASVRWSPEDHLVADFFFFSLKGFIGNLRNVEEVEEIDDDAAPAAGTVRVLYSRQVLSIGSFPWNIYSIRHLDH